MVIKFYALVIVVCISQLSNGLPQQQDISRFSRAISSSSNNNLFSGVIQGIEGFIDNADQTLNTSVGKAQTSADNIVNTVTTNVQKAISNLLDFIRKVIAQIKSILSSADSCIITEIDGIKKIISNVQNHFATCVKNTTSVATNLLGAYQNLFKNAFDFTPKIIETIMQCFGKPADCFTKTIPSFAEVVKSNIENTTAIFSSIGKEMGDGVSTGFTCIIETGNILREGVGNSLGNIQKCLSGANNNKLF